MIDNENSEEVISVKGSSRRRAGARRNGKAAREARRALVRKLEEIGVRSEALEEAEAKAVARRDKKIADATRRATEAYEKEIADNASALEQLWDEALSLDGAKESEIADYLATTVREVRQQRNKRINEQQQSSWE